MSGINFLSPILSIIYDLGIDLESVCELDYGNYIALFVIFVFALVCLVYTLKFLYSLMSFFLRGWN